MSLNSGGAVGIGQSAKVQQIAFRGGFSRGNRHRTGSPAKQHHSALVGQLSNIGDRFIRL